MSILYVQYTVDLECEECGYTWLEEGVSDDPHWMIFDCPRCEESNG